MKRLVLILAVMSLAVPLHAQLGATVAELSVRYGKIHKLQWNENRKDGEVIYLHQGYTVKFMLAGQRAQAIQISKLDGKPIQPPEAAAILKDFSNGQTWVPVSQPEPSALYRWTRSDKKAIAVCAPDERLILIHGVEKPPSP